MPIIASGGTRGRKRGSAPSSPVNSQTRRIRARTRFLHCCLVWIAWRASPSYYYHLLPRTCFLLRSSPTRIRLSPPLPSIRAISRPYGSLLSTLFLPFRRLAVIAPFVSFAILRHSSKNAYITPDTTHIILLEGKIAQKISGSNNSRRRKIQ